MTKNKCLSILFLPLCCVAALAIYGQINNQDAPAAPAQTPPTMPEHILYQNFFAHFKHLEARSNSPNKKPGEETLNEHYKKKLRLSEAEYRVILHIVNEYDDEMSAHVTRRKEIIGKLRAQFPGGKLTSKSDIPPVPDQVKELQREYEGVILKYSERLKRQLPPERNAEIASFLREELGPQLKVTRVPLPREKNPNNRRPQPFEK